MFHHTSNIVGLVLLLMVAACGDASSTPDGDGGEFVEDCPRLEMSTYEDCTYEDWINMTSPDSVAAFCASTCNKLDGLSVSNSSSLENLHDFEILTGIVAFEGGFGIYDHRSLSSLHGLEQLQRVGGDITFTYLPNLESLEALESLQSVGMNRGRGIQLKELNKLETLHGLESLEEISHSLIIEDNPNLRSIEQLIGLKRVKNIGIVNNPNLPTCQAEALAARLDPPGDVIISGNGSGSCD